MKPKVSVIVPVYRVEQLMRQAIDSLLEQTLKEIEIILVDDGSPDGSGAVCDEYAAQDSRVRVIHQQNTGLGLARNSGLAAAAGEYVGFMDSDDFVQPEMYERLYRTAEEENADYVGSGRFCLYEDGRMERQPYAEKRTVFRGADEMRQLSLGLIGAPPEAQDDTLYNMAVWGAIYRRSVLEQHQVRFCSERVMISEDMVFNLDFLPHAGCGVVLPECYYIYRYHTAGSLSKVYRPDRFEKDVNLYRYLSRKVIENGCPAEQSRQYLARMLSCRARYDLQMDVGYHLRNRNRDGARKKVLEVCAVPELGEVLKSYPWRKLPNLSHRLFFLCLKFRCAEGAVFLISLRQKAGRREPAENGSEKTAAKR